MSLHVTRAQLDTMKPSPYFLSNAELLSLNHFNPSKQCLDKLDKIGLNKFRDLLYCDPSFFQFMRCVMRIRINTSEMVAYWLMKNWTAKLREEVYGEPKSDVMNLTTGDMRELSTSKVTDTHLAKLETMEDEDFSVYIADSNFNKFVNQVVRLRPGFPPHLRTGVVKLWAQMVGDGLLTV
ncbi:hypothetical protein FPHYL_872 [Fusarium phyllophilum]|uniref:Uncharacterized protein n=1 Tax=Fusarium phyllophilum TaxID=47803 RepID=A0A8H5KEA7_9HYPO|nr:hypothetical protein FPHYL_872 [Fusarium phyllophilum]